MGESRQLSTRSGALGDRGGGAQLAAPYSRPRSHSLPKGTAGRQGEGVTSQWGTRANTTPTRRSRFASEAAGM